MTLRCRNCVKSLMTLFTRRRNNVNVRFSYRHIPFVLLAIFTFTFPAVADPHPKIIIRGAARFEVLTANLIRMEYSRGRKFVDAPSVAVQNRDLEETVFQSRDSDGWLEISTNKMRLRYRLGSGIFGPANLAISWSDEQGEHRWKPGDQDDKNLGGVPGDIALRTVAGKEPGPLSRNGYFVLDDSSTAVWNKLGDWVEPRPDGKEQDWYFFVYGRDFKGLLHEMTRLLGPIPMIPRYVLGAWFGSRTGYAEDEWKRIIYRFREEHIPLDIITLDSDSTAKIIWAGRDWDLEQMPDPPDFFKYAKSQGIKVVVNEHYGALTPENCSNFERIRVAMGLPVGTREIQHDLANRKYAELYMEVLNKPALEAGMAFWWQDGNASAHMNGLDPTLWTRHVEYTGTERITGQRAFDFERLDVPYQKTNATPAWGGHRYGGFFTGDLAAHWSTLDLLIPFNVQAGNMLIPYVINDNPGFTPQVVDNELYQRSVQFHALSPIFWWHGVWGLRMPWEYGPDVLEDARRFLQLRSSLVPYLYTYSRLAHETGEPIVRGTYIEYPFEEGAYQFRHQYMLGEELLVAPISEPGLGKPVLRQIYLPAGDQWFDWFTGRTYGGGQTIFYECPLNRMPVFVKAGSILPLAPPMDYTDQRALDPLTVEVFTGKSGAFRLYEDDGTSLNYRKGEYSWTQIGFTPSSILGQYTITIGPTQGHYQGQQEKRRYKICVHGLFKPRSVRMDSNALPEIEDLQSEAGWRWDEQRHLTTINLSSLRLQNPVTVTLERAGSFEAGQLLQRVIDYRARVRKIEVAEKLKWGTLLRGEDIKKEPRVLRETEQIEQALNVLIENPEQLEHEHPEFNSWTARILASFADHPFESNRTIPELDPDAIKSTRSIENAQFSPAEISEMTTTLLGCVLAAKANGTSSPSIMGRLDYDSESLPDAQVIYELSLPPENLPDWGEVRRTLDDQHFIHFEIQAPLPSSPGAQLIRVKATLKWSGGHIEMTRDVQWASSGDTGS